VSWSFSPSVRRCFEFCGICYDRFEVSLCPVRERSERPFPRWKDSSRRFLRRAAPLRPRALPEVRAGGRGAYPRALFGDGFNLSIANPILARACARQRPGRSNLGFGLRGHECLPLPPHV